MPLIDKLAAIKVKVVVHTEFFFEPQLDPGLGYIRKMKAALDADTDPARASSARSSQLAQLMTEAEADLDTDGQLAASLKRAGNVILASHFPLGEPQDNAGQSLPTFARQSSLDDKSGFSLAALRGQQPIESLGAVAAGIGHLNQLQDADGTVRFESLLVNEDGQAVPSMVLLAALKGLNLAIADIKLNVGESVQIGNLRLHTDGAARLLPQFYKGRNGKPAFSVDSFDDVLSGKIAASKFTNKIVVIGATAAGVGTAFGLLSGAGLWLKLVFPATLLLIGSMGLASKRVLMPATSEPKSDENSTETNRMMGLALQGQGQLDMAFDWFRRVPMTPPLMGNLYSLALDFERKRQFGQAVAVYDYMATYNQDYKDLKSKLKRAKDLSETLTGSRANADPGGTRRFDGGAAEPTMLGRYQIEQELGKGAMGVVYLGKDPKIGRVVAIKTLALSDEFEGGALVDARERFFREAETAGRLQHQNIVTIFDAGEEHDLAYIAMEFLKGKDLVDYCKDGHLLPIATVISIVARVAEALAYAHKQHVVHRDIKPANIMYEAESDTVKVTDFGIARITDSSRTKTGLVLGTPQLHVT